MGFLWFGIGAITGSFISLAAVCLFSIGKD